MKQLKPGMRLRSAVCATEIMVIKATARECDLRCGGHPMLEFGDSAAADTALERAGPSQMGKRYVDAADTLEVLCTRGGDGALELDGKPLGFREARALPSSD